MHKEFCQGKMELRKGGASPLVADDRQMRAIPQDLAGQAGKDPAGTAFHKNPGPGLIHVFDLFDKTHAADQMFDQTVFDDDRIIGVRDGGDIGEDRQGWLPHGQLLQVVVHCRAGRGNQRRMEGAAHRQLSTLDPL